MTEMSPEKDNKSKALPKALVNDEEKGVANAAAGKETGEQPKPRNYKWLAVFFMSVALVSVATNAGLTIAIVTKSVGAYTQKHVYAVSLTSRLDSAGESVVAEVPCVEVLEVIASIKNGDDDQGLVMIPLGNGEFSAPAMSAARYQVHEDSFGVDQIFLSDDRDISYNISCETSMAACETNPFLLCDVQPSAVTSSGRRALHAFEDAFDGEPTLQRHPLRQLKLFDGKPNWPMPIPKPKICAGLLCFPAGTWLGKKSTDKKSTDKKSTDGQNEHGWYPFNT